MATKIFNFSHPLSARAENDLRGLYGEIRVVTIHVQLDQTQSVISQATELARQAHRENGWPDAIILPGLALAAVGIDRYFSTPLDDYPSVQHIPLIRLILEPGVTPPVFIVGGVE